MAKRLSKYKKDDTIRKKVLEEYGLDSYTDEQLYGLGGLLGSIAGGAGGALLGNPQLGIGIGGMIGSGIESIFGGDDNSKSANQTKQSIEPDTQLFKPGGEIETNRMMSMTNQPTNKEIREYVKRHLKKGGQLGDSSDKTINRLLLQQVKEHGLNSRQNNRALASWRRDMVKATHNKYEDGGNLGDPPKTKLTEQEEKQFNEWYNKVAKYKELSNNPDDSNQYYDYRGYWKNENRDEMLKNPKDVHFIDRYKTPGHPTFSNESIYSTDKEKGGQWTKDGDNWYFHHSPYTEKYADKTAEYLQGSGDSHIIGTDTLRNVNDYIKYKTKNSNQNMLQKNKYGGRLKYEDGSELTTYNGAKHEQGGITLPSTGTQVNEVEDGETGVSAKTTGRNNTYILNNSTPITIEDAAMFNIDKKYIGKTPAEVSKRLEKFYSFRKNSPIDMDDFKVQMNKLTDLNDMQLYNQEVDAMKNNPELMQQKVQQQAQQMMQNQQKSNQQPVQEQMQNSNIPQEQMMEQPMQMKCGGKLRKYQKGTELDNNPDFSKIAKLTPQNIYVSGEGYDFGNFNIDNNNTVNIPEITEPISFNTNIKNKQTIKTPSLWDMNNNNNVKINEQQLPIYNFNKDINKINPDLVKVKYNNESIINKNNSLQSNNDGFEQLNNTLLPEQTNNNLLDKDFLSQNMGSLFDIGRGITSSVFPDKENFGRVGIVPVNLQKVNPNQAIQQAKNTYQNAAEDARRTGIPLSQYLNVRRGIANQEGNQIGNIQSQYDNQNIQIKNQEAAQNSELANRAMAMNQQIGQQEKIAEAQNVAQAQNILQAGLSNLGQNLGIANRDTKAMEMEKWIIGSGLINTKDFGLHTVYDNNKPEQLILSVGTGVDGKQHLQSKDGRLFDIQTKKRIGQ